MNPLLNIMTTSITRSLWKVTTMVLSCVYIRKYSADTIAIFELPCFVEVLLLILMMMMSLFPVSNTGFHCGAWETCRRKTIVKLCLLFFPLSNCCNVFDNFTRTDTANMKTAHVSFLTTDIKFSFSPTFTNQVHKNAWCYRQRSVFNNANPFHMKIDFRWSIYGIQETFYHFGFNSQSDGYCAIKLRSFAGTSHLINNNIPCVRNANIYKVVHVILLVLIATQPNFTLLLRQLHCY